MYKEVWRQTCEQTDDREMIPMFQLTKGSDTGDIIMNYKLYYQWPYV